MFTTRLSSTARYFNPRPREGSDSPISAFAVSDDISTHAPARGATLADSIIDILVRNFNPRPREGSDDILCNFFNSKNHFNPRPREGSDDFTSICDISCIGFQPTPPRGERQNRIRISTTLFPISTHAPARGATLHEQEILRAMSVFQPTPPRGERQSRKNGKCPKRGHFNPRPREGSDID